MLFSSYASTEHSQPDGHLAFSIVTPSFNQLDWLRLCVASVRDQVATKSQDSGIRDSTSVTSKFTVEHVIQDAGTPGIETFARETGAELYRDGQLIFSFSESRDFSASRHCLVIYCESDHGMYDAINRGLAKTTGQVCAWLNSDEQYLPGTLTKVAHYFHKNRYLDVLLGDAILTDGFHNPLSYRRIMVPSRWHTRLDHLHSLSCAMFFKRAALPTPPLDSRWKVIGDAVLMDFFLANRRNIHACHELLSAYSFTGDNLSTKPTGEREQWRRETRYPPGIFRFSVVVWHRVRRLLAGAYRPRHIHCFLFDSPSKARSEFRALVKATWPKTSMLTAPKLKSASQGD